MADDPAKAGHERDPELTSIDHAFHALRRNRPIPPDLDLDDAERQLVDDLTPWLDALEAAAHAPPQAQKTPSGGPPPVRHDDPVALMLGLVPDPNIALDGNRLSIARKKAKLNLAEFLQRLNERGWEVTIQQTFQWEQGTTALAPALIDAIADELGVDRQALLASAAVPSERDDLFDDSRVRAFLSQWADEAEVTVDFLRDRTAKMLATAAYRNKTSGSVDGLLGVLQVLKEIPNLLDPYDP
ncbi:helix-turn-helix domain-containing protein [Saccharothrix xinjiangensis]|uniref:Helix-turn-helix domain-containing protein n=1 Tax=Saccharothrix xinjiangensis TaxID=204798 RepID=A0ABV9Y1B3_9PSEU